MFLGLAACPSARAQVVAYEDFNYTAGTSISGLSGGDSFGGGSPGHSGSGVFFGTNVAGSLSYTDSNSHTLNGNAGSLIVRITGPASRQSCNLRFQSGGVLFVCARGSIPDLPASADAQLLAAIPRMQPWPAGCGSNRWVLREGRQDLVHFATDIPGALGLSDETGSFQVKRVNAKTGEITPLPRG
jgi:hypothetical protein